MKLVKKPNGYYYARVKGSDGKIKEFSTRQKSKARAEAAAREANLEALEQAAQAKILTAEAITRIVAGKRITCEKAMEDWKQRLRAGSKAPKTIHNSIATVSRWIAHEKLDKKPPSTITFEALTRYINSPMGGHKASTRNTNLSAIRSFLEFCTNEGWRVGNPAKDVAVTMETLTHEQKEPRKINPFLPEEVSLILSMADGPFWPFATLLSFETGLRLGDIAQLEWAAFEGRTLTLWTDKRNQRVGPFTLSRKARTLLKAVPLKNKRYLFPEQCEIYQSSTRRALLSVQFKSLCQSLGIEGKTFHSLRHAYASATFKEEKRRLIEQLQQELAELSVAEKLGHSQVSTTRGYLH